MEDILKYNPYEVRITYNEHKGLHQSIQDSFEDNKDEFIDWEECLKTGNVVCIQVYPENSVGFYIVYASTYEKALKETLKVLKAIRG